MTLPIEDLLRAATRDAAAEIDSVGPLEEGPLDRSCLTRRRRTDGLPLGVPLAAAAAVVAVAGLSVTLPHMLGGAAARSAGAQVTAGTGRSATARPSTGPESGSSGTVPAFYATLTGTQYPWYDHTEVITIRSTYSGRVLATLTPAAAGFGTFDLVAPGTNDEEFIVGAQPWDPVSNAAYAGNNNAAAVALLLLRFDPATRDVTITRLPGPAVAGGNVQGVALSPDGTELAVAAQVSTADLELSVYSLATGAARSWAVTGAAASGSGFGTGFGTDVLSWRPDGHTLAFDWTGPVPGSSASVSGIRLLDTTQPGGDLLTGSQPVFTLSQRRDQAFTCTDALVLSSDGMTVTCAGSEVPAGGGTSSSAVLPGAPSFPGTPSPAMTYGFGEFSVATGTLVTVIDPTVDPSDAAVNQQLYWTDGSSLIGTLDGPVFVLKDGQEQVIPWASDISPAQGATNDAAW